MSLTIPKDLQAQIALALSSLPAIQGKVSLHLEFHCGTGGHVASISVSVTKQELIKAM
jgi:hypothetical protein